jgi:putative transposase
MTDRVVEVGVGTQVWFEGSIWRVEEMSCDAVTLSAGQRLRSVTTRLLATQAVVMDDGPGAPEDQDLVAVLLSNLAPKELAALEERAGHIRAPLADEGSDSGAGGLHRRYATKAAELGVSVRTLERWVAAYRDAGVTSCRGPARPSARRPPPAPSASHHSVAAPTGVSGDDSPSG